MKLTEKEFDLLRALVEADGRVVTRESLEKRIQSRTRAAAGRSVDMPVAAIRRKLGRFGNLLKTARGAGDQLRRAPEEGG